jgi:hypothetical protein
MFEIDSDIPLPGETTDPLASPGAREKLAATIKADIDEYCQRAYSDGHRKHLGASILGHECPRYPWYVFRWVLDVKHSGRMLRLFQRGHLEEKRFTEYLRGIGATVQEFDPNAEGGKAEKQFRVKGYKGHAGGGLDTQIILPERYGECLGMIAEYKTSGTGSSFTSLGKKGVQLTKPVHYDQMCIYGAAYGYKYALYLATNKNDDDLHVEIVPINYKRAQELSDKSADIIDAQIAPMRVAESPAYQACKMCDFARICHHGEAIEQNCRSCANARAADAGRWECSVFGMIPENHDMSVCPAGHYTPIA